MDREHTADGERVHVCYTLSDEKSTYSKFAGASLCSLLKNTKAPVTVHLLYDILSEENRERFGALVRDAGQEIEFYDVPRVIRPTLERGAEIFAEGLESSRYTAANMFRLAIPEVLPPEVEKAIFLDADTIVHLDIAELWREDMKESAVAAVSDRELLQSYGREAVGNPAVSYLYDTGKVTEKTVFNAGVLVMRLDLLRRRENLLLEGLRFLAEHAGEYRYYDNDVLIYFFAESFCHLPTRYNLRVEWEMKYGAAEARPAIYHFVGRQYDLAGRDARQRLFLRYYTESPWHDETTLWRGCDLARGATMARAGERLRKVRRIYNLCCRKQRVFAGTARDEARLRREFGLGPEEPYMVLETGGVLRAPYPPDTHVYLFFWPDYAEIKEMMERAGMREYEHFADGTWLMPERMDDMMVSDLTLLWHI